MKTITIKINASSPQGVAEALDEIKQAVYLGIHASNDGNGKDRYSFESKGEYDK